MATLKSAAQAASRNEILAGLLPADFRMLEEDLTRVELHVPKQLESPNKRISHVYFTERGIAFHIQTTRPLYGRGAPGALAPDGARSHRHRRSVPHARIPAGHARCSPGFHHRDTARVGRRRPDCHKRSTIAIVDRVRLQKRANGAYVPPKRE